MGTEVIGESKSIEYSTPLKIVEPLIKEFNITGMFVLVLKIINCLTIGLKKIMPLQKIGKVIVG